MSKTPKNLPIADQDYPCMACEWVDAEYSDLIGGMTKKEVLQYDRARKNGFMIKKNEKYIDWHGFWDGEPHDFRAIPEIHAICKRLNIYDS